MTRSYLMLGDPHGDLDFVELATAFAAEHRADIVQVGDWGFVWPGANNLEYLSTLTRRYGVVHRFVDGNHDDHPALRDLVEQHSAACSTLPGGGVEIAPGVVYQPRGSSHTDEDGTRFLFCGGAPSIDHAGRTPGRSWWPEETISAEEFATALAAEGPFHVLVTHDAPDYPPGFAPKGDPEFRVRSRRSLGQVAALIDHHRPGLHVHGHWHSRSTTRRGSTRVEALDCNHARFFADAVLLWSRDGGDA